MTRETTEPYAIEFVDGYYAVKQCYSPDHAEQRAKEDHPKKRIKSLRKVK